METNSNSDNATKEIPLYMLRHNFEQQLLNAKAAPYTIILALMNDLYGTKHKNLSLFKNFAADKLKNDEIELVIVKHNPTIKEQFKYELDKSKSSPKYIITCLRKMLKSIEWKITKKQDSGMYSVIAS